MAGDPVELCIGDLEFMSSGSIACPEARLADFVRHVKQMQFVPAFGFLDDAEHPGSGSGCICGKIENDRQTGAQELNNMRFQRGSQLFRTSDIVGKRCEFVGIKTGQPGIFRQEDRAVRRREGPRQR